MRDAERGRKPDILRKHAARWAREYVEAVERGDKQLIRRRRSRYNHAQVREALGDMYRHYCCYCEGEVSAVRADQIEHRMPVVQFPESTFDWDNLHLSCTGCNQAKSDQWDSRYPILDAVKDAPVDQHLTYEESSSGIRRVSLTQRGRTTIKHADLNRNKLREGRAAVFLGVLGVVKEIRTRLEEDPSDSTALDRLDELVEKSADRYGSMIAWAIRDWLSPYVSTDV